MAMHFKSPHSLILFVLLMSASLRSYAQDTRKILASYFADVSSGKHPPLPTQLLKSVEASTTLSAVESYLTDTTSVVRNKAYAVVQAVGSRASDAVVRKDAVAKLIRGVTDRDPGNVGQVLTFLSNFAKTDFTPAGRDTLANIFQRGSEHYSKLIRLVGFLEIHSLQTPLRELAQRSNASRQDRWSATLALARMGDAFAVENMMRRVRKLPVTDEVVYEIFPDLVYTRQRQALELLIENLHSNLKNCSSADAERPVRIPCAYRIMEMIEPAVEGYPLKLDESGDVIADDYAVALRTARDWFKAHTNYKIRTDRQ